MLGLVRVMTDMLHWLRSEFGDHSLVFTLGFQRVSQCQASFSMDWGLSFITNSTIIVEGVIADIIDEYCVNTGVTPGWGAELEKATWSDKKDKYNSMFQRKLESYKG